MELYFYEPRLKMTVLGRLAIRSVSYAIYGFLVASSILLLAGDIPWLKSLGAIFALFLIDRLRYAKKADRSLVKIPKGKVNTAFFLSSSGFSVIEWAFDRASLVGENFYLYVALRLLKRKEIQEGLLRMDIKPEELISRLKELIHKPSERKISKTELLDQAGKLVEAAFYEAIKTGNAQIDPKDLFPALSVIGDETISKIFQLFDIEKDDLENALIFSRFKSIFWNLKRMPASLAGLLSRPYKIRHRIMNRAWTAKPTPFLDQFAEDITDLARTEEVGFLIGHEKEYDRLTDVLSRPGRPNALLVGDPGSGKSTLVAHLAYQIIKDRVPSPLFDKRLVKLEVGSLVAGANEGEIQERMKKILDEIIRAGNIILYIPDIHNLLKTSGQMRVSAADILLPAIKGSAFSVIGATYPQEFKNYIEPNSEFASAFELIRVQEISENEAGRYLVYSAILLERQYKMIISFSAIKDSVSLARRYFKEKLLPASAEDLLKETLADASEKKKKFIAAADVVAVAEKKINVPIHRAGKEEAEKLLNLEKVIHERLIDQEEAVAAVARSLREYRSGLSRKGGPIATFLFIGPTGVGKTELSKILAKIQFGSSEVMLRFDMSEYQDKTTINRLLENITRAVYEKPYSLVLLDEFEKAHSDILNLFLQVFDDGRLTDSNGRTVDFQNTIIIATSNAHSDLIKSEIEKGINIKQLSEILKKKLSEYFRPELLNRLSSIIVFKPLSPEHIKEITRILLKDLAKDLQESQRIELNFEESVAEELARLGYDPVFGARPLRNVISEKLRGVLAEKILKGEIKKGGSLKVTVKEGKFNFINV